MQDPVAASNFEALNSKSLEVRFDLAGTDYVALENIGTGAYGVVCSAINRHRGGERVAIKKIPDIFGQVTVARRTYREIKILKHFRHDNIISIRDILQPSDDKLKTYCDVYIVLDLMESDLHRIIYSPQELTDEHVRYFLYQILRGLKYIHSANIVHRDLKPSNLLVNENCELKIGDFGMARGISSSPDDHNIKMTQYVATRWYRAPELILLTLNYTAAIDMWSVGCILAEMLGRRHLFPGQNYRHQLELIFNVVGSPTDNYINMTSSIIGDFLRMFPKKDPADLHKLYPSASAKAVRLIGQMLKMEPDSRILAEDALNDPYLSRYHDPDDEPICVPAFDFSFEQQDMDADALRYAITEEMQDYRRPKLPVPCILRPVTVTSQAEDTHSSNETDDPPVIDLTVDSTSFSQSEPSESVTGTSFIKDTSSADDKLKLKVPGISAAEFDIDRNSVEMPSANTFQQPDDVTMFSARSGSDNEGKLTKEICQDTVGIGNNSDWTDCTNIRDDRTDPTVANDDLISEASV